MGLGRKFKDWLWSSEHDTNVPEAFMELSNALYIDAAYYNKLADQYPHRTLPHKEYARHATKILGVMSSINRSMERLMETPLGLPDMLEVIQKAEELLLQGRGGTQ